MGSSIRSARERKEKYSTCQGIEDKELEEMERNAEKDQEHVYFSIREAYRNALEAARTGIDRHRCYDATVHISAGRIEIQVVRCVAGSSPPASPHRLPIKLQLPRIRLFMVTLFS